MPTEPPLCPHQGEGRLEWGAEGEARFLSSRSVQARRTCGPLLSFRTGFPLFSSLILLLDDMETRRHRTQATMQLWKSEQGRRGFLRPVVLGARWRSLAPPRNWPVLVSQGQKWSLRPNSGFLSPAAIGWSSFPQSEAWEVCFYRHSTDVSYGSWEIPMGWRFTLGECPASSEPSESLFQLLPPCSWRPECDHTVPTPGPSLW